MQYPTRFQSFGRFVSGFLNACLLSLALVFLLVATSVALTRGVAAFA